MTINQLTGQLVVDENKVFLQLDNGSLTELDETCRIEVQNGDKFERVSVRKILSSLNQHGWHTYAGVYATVEKKGAII